MKRLPTPELLEIITKHYEKSNLTFREIASHLKKQNVTGPKAHGYLTEIAVNKIYTRAKGRTLKKVVVADGPDNLKETLRALLKVDIDPATFIKIVKDLVNT